MIIYPPFNVVNKGVVLNMGYGWVFDPPKRGYMTATVNISMLLIQWLGVLVVGGIVFFLSKGTSLPLGTSPRLSTGAIEPIDKEGENLYEAILGDKNRTYYLKRFEEFDKQVIGIKASWNWPAFFFGGTWALYRKMYGWFMAFLGIMIISGFFEKEGFSGWGFFLLFGPWIVFAISANQLYHYSVKTKITAAQLSINDKSKLLEFLRQKGGVHTWVIWVCCLLLVTGILAAIAIPQFTANQESTYRTAAKEDVPDFTIEPIPAPPPAPAPVLTPESEQEHFDKIKKTHPDFEKYRDNGAIKIWIQKQPRNLRVSLQKTYDKGDSDSVIALLSLFKKDNNIPAILNNLPDPGKGYKWVPLEEAEGLPDPGKGYKWVPLEEGK